MKGKHHPNGEWPRVGWKYVLVVPQSGTILNIASVASFVRQAQLLPEIYQEAYRWYEYSYFTNYSYYFSSWFVCNTCLEKTTRNIGTVQYLPTLFCKRETTNPVNKILSIIYLHMCKVFFSTLETWNSMKKACKDHRNNVFIIIRVGIGICIYPTIYHRRFLVDEKFQLQIERVQPTFFHG